MEEDGERRGEGCGEAGDEGERTCVFRENFFLVAKYNPFPRLNVTLALVKVRGFLSIPSRCLPTYFFLARAFCHLDNQYRTWFSWSDIRIRRTVSLW
jgi:hypothetical protein